MPAKTPPATTPVILGSTMGTDQWDLSLPTGVVVAAVIAKLLSSPDLPFREQDDNGRRVPYRLMWREGERLLRETETLGDAGVSAGDHIIMTHQARAGRGYGPGFPA
jgi:hypothetical protein